MDAKERFKDNPNMLISDSETNLFWLPKDSYGDLGKWLTWDEIQGYVQTMKSVYAGGFNDWRLPSKEEALSLYDPDLAHQGWDDKDVHIHQAFVAKCAHLILTSEIDEEGKVLYVNLRDGSSEYVSKLEKEFISTRLCRKKS